MEEHPTIRTGNLIGRQFTFLKGLPVSIYSPRSLFRPFKIGTRGAVWIFLAAALASGDRAQASGFDSTETNAKIAHDIVRSLTVQALAKAGIVAETVVSLRLKDQAGMWLMREGITRALADQGCLVLDDTSAAPGDGVLVEAAEYAVDPVFRDSFRDGFLGTELYSRSIAVSLTLHITSLPDHRVLLSETFTETRGDTIEAADAGSYDLSLPARKTRDDRSRTIWDRVLEPFVILGATGVAVFLLFHIRS